MGKAGDRNQLGHWSRGGSVRKNWIERARRSFSPSPSAGPAVGGLKDFVFLPKWT